MDAFVSFIVRYNTDLTLTLTKYMLNCIKTHQISKNPFQSYLNHELSNFKSIDFAYKIRNC